MQVPWIEHRWDDSIPPAQLTILLLVGGHHIILSHPLAASSPSSFSFQLWSKKMPAHGWSWDQMMVQKFRDKACIQPLSCLHFCTNGVECWILSFRSDAPITPVGWQHLVFWMTPRRCREDSLLLNSADVVFFFVLTSEYSKKKKSEEFRTKVDGRAGNIRRQMN